MLHLILTMAKDFVLLLYFGANLITIIVLMTSI